VLAIVLIIALIPTMTANLRTLYLSAGLIGLLAFSPYLLQ
jgi:hypothetical protein